MNISHYDATRDLQEIKQLLHPMGLTDVEIEYPAYLSIIHNGVEYHAGYSFIDEYNDTAEFQLYDANDGVYGERFAMDFATDGDLLNIALRIAYELSISKLTKDGN